MTIPDEFDIIVCGGGSTGCVIAGRFVENLHTWSLAVLGLTGLQACKPRP